MSLGYQNALTNYETRLDTYRETRDALKRAVTPEGVARTATKDITPLILAESGIHGGKAFMSNIRNTVTKGIQNRFQQGVDATGRVLNNRFASPVERVYRNPSDVPEFTEPPADLPRTPFYSGQRAVDSHIVENRGLPDQVPDLDDIADLYPPNVRQPTGDTLQAHQQGFRTRLQQYRDADPSEVPADTNLGLRRGLANSGRPQVQEGRPAEYNPARVRLSPTQRTDLVDSLQAQKTQNARDLEGDLSPSESRMLSAQNARMGRIQSVLRKEPEEAADVEGDVLPSRPAVLPDTRVTRLARASQVRDGALEQAERLQGQNNAFESLSGRRVPEVDDRIRANQNIADRAGTQMNEIQQEPDPNDPAVQAYHDGMDDAKIGLDRSAGYNADLQPHYTAGAQDLNNYKKLESLHDSALKANVADEGSEDVGTGIVTGLEGDAAAAAEAGPETEGAGFLAAGGLALAGLIASLAAPEGHAAAPPPPTFARIGSSQGLL